MTKLDIKTMHSTELREIRSMIREELNFRAEVGKEINKQQPGIRNYVEGSFEHMVNSDTIKHKSDQLKFELHGPGPDEER
jgi:hypothetical protein|tara:strand:+ start:1802 stop:2041 length:240 start_codon:yes stop_codon:yes gene_type:complete